MDLADFRRLTGSPRCAETLSRRAQPPLARCLPTALTCKAKVRRHRQKLRSRKRRASTRGVSVCAGREGLGGCTPLVKDGQRSTRLLGSARQTEPVTVRTSRCLCADHFAKPVLGGQGGQKHGQDRLPVFQRDLDPTVRAETIWNELDQLLEHAQGVEMSLIEAIEFRAMPISSRVFPIHKAKKVLRHCSNPVLFSVQADLRGGPVRAGREISCNFSDLGPKGSAGCPCIDDG